MHKKGNENTEKGKIHQIRAKRTQWEKEQASRRGKEKASWWDIEEQA